MLTSTSYNIIKHEEIGLKIPRSLRVCGFNSRPRHQLYQGFQALKAWNLFLFRYESATIYPVSAYNDTKLGQYKIVLIFLFYSQILLSAKIFMAEQGFGPCKALSQFWPISNICPMFN